MPRTIGIVVENYVAGGSDVVANQLAMSMSSANVIIFTNVNNDDRNLLRELDTGKIRIVRYRWKTLVELGAAAAKLRKRGHTAAGAAFRCINVGIRYPHIFASVLFWARVFKSHDIDLVVSNNGAYPGGEMCRAAVLAARLLRKPAVMIVHSMPTRAPAVLRPFEKILDYMIARSATLVAVSRAIAEAFPNIRDLHADSVIENAVRRPPIMLGRSPTAGVTGILSIGAISPWKNQIRAVNVYRRLVQRLSTERPDLPIPILNIIGPVADESYHEALRTAIAENRLGNERIFLEGYGDVQQHLAKPGQLLLITSDIEGLPLVLLEAMSCGVPTVATRVGGIPGVIDGMTGKLCDPNDLEGLARALWDYVTIPTFYQQASAQSSASFEKRFDLDAWTNRYENLFREVWACAEVA